MKSIIPILNRKVISYIKALDSNPENARPVTFWFYSANEEKNYRLAAYLQNIGYQIVCCEFSNISGNWLCIAERTLSPGIELLDQVCMEMSIVAEHFGVEFDGWETACTPFRR